MDPLRLLPGEPSGAGEHAQPQPRDAAARWRQELERAQWALRTREAGGPAAASRGDAAPATAPMSRAPALPVANRADASFSESSGQPMNRPGSGPAAAPGQPFAQPRSAAAAPNPAGAAASSARPLPESRAAPPAPAAEHPAPAPERFTWPRTHVHVMARDGATYVWVRDGTLDQTERRRLAAQLAARLRAAGVRLGSLAVNGEEILNMEGVTSWQSKQ